MTIRTLINPNAREVLDGTTPDRAPLRFHRRLPGYEETRRALGVSRDTRVLVFNTEGSTDPDTYRRITAG